MKAITQILFVLCMLVLLVQGWVQASATRPPQPCTIICPTEPSRTIYYCDASWTADFSNDPFINTQCTCPESNAVWCPEWWCGACDV